MLIYTEVKYKMNEVFNFVGFLKIPQGALNFKCLNIPPIFILR